MKHFLKHQPFTFHKAYKLLVQLEEEIAIVEQLNEQEQSNVSYHSS